MLQAQEAQGQGEGPYEPVPIAPLIFDTFLGINTQASRPGIGDTEMFVCDGFIPLGKNNLRTLPDVGPAMYQSGFKGSIQWFDFGNIGTTPVCISFFYDGSIKQINTQTGMVTNIAPSGTIKNPTRGNCGITQWGNQFIIIVANQQNGYFAWDGSIFYQTGTIAPLVNVTNSGLNYTGQPTFIVETTGSGSGPTFTVELNNDVIEQINVTNAGSGFGINDFVNLVIQGGGSDNSARATVTIGPGGGIETIDVLNGGKNYDLAASANVVGGGGTGASIAINFIGAGGHAVVQSVTIIDPGQGYTSIPTIQIINGGAGTGAEFAVNITQGVISAINVFDGGSGYVSIPTINVIGDGTGGTFLVQINDAGQVTGVVVINGGSGWTKALVQFSGGNNAAAATIDMMPFGIQGTYAETYQSRVWVGNQNKLSFTAADSLSDFATSDGGGTIEATDSFLRNQYTALKQTNGFLYLIADSSENYISGVTTSGGPPSTTTFNNQNADPEIGTSWPGSVTVINRNIMFGNPIGVHVSYGGAVTKVSDDLDGIYTTVPNFAGILPSAAKAIIFGKKIWMLLLPVIDQISGQQVNKLFMWNGKKWFTSQQGVNLIFINFQELNSELTAYGTDGTNIYPLFQQPSTNFTKTVQSKLWDKPGGYMLTKVENRLWGLFVYNQLAGSSVSVSIDNENGSFQNTATVAGPLAEWLNAGGNVVTWTNGTAVTPWTNSGVGIVVLPPTAISQNGVLVGFTLQTQAADMTVVSLAVDAQPYAYRG